MESSVALYRALATMHVEDISTLSFRSIVIRTTLSSRSESRDPVAGPESSVQCFQGRMTGIRPTALRSAQDDGGNRMLPWIGTSPAARGHVHNRGRLKF